MPIHSAPWQALHAPLIAFAVAIALACAGRFLRIALLAAAAGGGGVLAGWFAITGRWRFASPVLSVDELATLAAAALVIGLVFTCRNSGRFAWLAGPFAALVTAWLLIGAPVRLSVLQADWPTALGVVVAVLLFVRALAEALDPLRLGLAGLTLAVAFQIAGAPPVWTQLALVPGLAGLAMFTAPSLPAAAALPIAVDIAGLGCLAVLDLGRMRRLGFSAMDAAALSPLLAVLLQPRTTERMNRLGGLASLAGALLAGAIAVGCVWLVRLIK
jgi:hypothetical protein